MKKLENSMNKIQNQINLTKENVINEKLKEICAIHYNQSSPCISGFQFIENDIIEEGIQLLEIENMKMIQCGKSSSFILNLGKVFLKIIFFRKWRIIFMWMGSIWSIRFKWLHQSKYFSKSTI